jgi:hypothetical protein
MNFNKQFVDDLIRWGYQPLPVVGATKRPIFARWQSDTFSADAILSSSLTALGLRMGDNGLQAIDVDIKNAPEPFVFLDEFKKVYSDAELPFEKLIWQSTMSGGAHIIYRTDNPLPSKKLALNEEGAATIELRGTKSQVVIYEPDKFNKLQSLPTLNDEELFRLYSVIFNFDKTNKEMNKRKDFTDYNNANSCLDILMNHGWTVVNENDSWYELLRDGNPTSSNSGKVFKDTNRAYIWSTSTSLPSCETLTPAALSCFLDFGGDWKSFSRSIGVNQWTQNDTRNNLSIFQITSPNKTILMSDELLPKPLIGALWQEGELAVLFGPTNIGKSILAVDIADAIASGSGLFDGMLPTATPKKVLYIDFELTEKQFALRYKGRNFSGNFSRATPNYDFANLVDFRKNVIVEMMSAVQQLGAEILIVDNLSNVNPDNTQALDAALLVQDFKRMKNELNISILLIGHTPKMIPGVSIELTHLAGSAQLSNLIDSCFALNKVTRGANVYIKQLKQRNDEQMYGSENVIIGQIEKGEYLQFKYFGTCVESELLAFQESRDDRNEKIRQDYKSQQISVRELAKKYDLGKTQVADIVKGVRPEN